MRHSRIGGILMVLRGGPLSLGFSNEDEDEESACETQSEEGTGDEGVSDPDILKEGCNGVTHRKTHGVPDQSHGDHTLPKKLKQVRKKTNQSGHDCSHHRIAVTDVRDRRSPA